MQRDATVEQIELAVLGREPRLESCLVTPLLLELLQPPEFDEEIQIHRGRRDVLEGDIARVEQLVVVHVRHVDGRTGPEVVPAAGHDDEPRAIQDVDRLFTVPVPTGVLTGRDRDRAQVGPVRRKADLVADEHRDAMFVGRLDPVHVSPARDDRRALDIQRVPFTGGQPLCVEVGSFEPRHWAPSLAHRRWSSPR